MKRFLLPFLGLALALVAATSSAQTYPYNNPTYIPTSTLAPQSFTATGDYTFVTNGVASATVRIVKASGATYTAAIQGTNDGASVSSPTWTTLQALPVGGGSLATSFTASGFWQVNTAGFTKIRVHITAVGGTGGLTVTAAGTLASNITYIANPQAISGPVGIIGTDGVSTWDCAADGSCETNLTRVAGAAVATGAGTASGALRVELPTDGTGLVGAAPKATATGGGSMTHVISAASTNSTSVKGSAGTVYTITAANTNATTAYLKLYNTASAPTCNSDTVQMTFTLLQNVPRTIDIPVGAAFGTGIGLCITGAAADNDNTSATTGIVVSVVYK